MKHFTNTLHQGVIDEMEKAGYSASFIPSIAEAFDWFIDKGYYFCIVPHMNCEEYASISFSEEVDSWDCFVNGEIMSTEDTWEKSAEQGILEVLKIWQQ